MEEISIAYLQAVAAACGYAIANWSQDQNCIDLTISASGIIGEFSDPKVDVQLKATADPSNLTTQHLSIQVSAKQYDQLQRRASTPKILVGLFLPSDERTWIEVTAEQLAIRKCAYYAVTTGLPPLNSSQTKSKTIQLPFAQVFNPGALQAIMKKISNGQPL